jgi:hypothetical protein
MKRISTTSSVQTADASLDATLNPVQLASKAIVPWSVAFPRTATKHQADTRTGP